MLQIRMGLFWECSRLILWSLLEMIKSITLFFSVNHPLNIDKIGKSKIIDQDLSKHNVDLHTNGLGYRKISCQLNVPLSSLGTIVCHGKTCHSIHPRKSSGCLSRKVVELTARLLARKVGKEPQVTLKEFQGGRKVNGVQL